MGKTEKRKEQMRQASRRYRLRKKTEKLLRLKQEEKEHEERMNPKKKVVVVMDNEYANGETSIDSGDFKKIVNVCEWCGALKGLDSNRLCEFCRQFDSKEEMLAEREWSKRESMIRRIGSADLIPKYRRQYHADWKCNCGFVNPYYKKECKKCGASRNIAKGGKLDKI